MLIHEFLAMPLSQRQQLRALNISDNDLSLISDVVFNTFIDALLQCDALQQLDLSNTSLHQMDTARLSTLLDTLGQLHELDVLNLANNRFDLMSEDSFAVLQNVCMRCNALGLLVLSGCGLCMAPARFRAIAMSLRNYGRGYTPPAILPAMALHTADAPAAALAPAAASAASRILQLHNSI